MFDNILPDLMRVLLSCENLECKVDLGTCKVDNGVPLVAAWRFGGSLITVVGSVEAWWQPGVPLAAEWRRLWWPLVAAWRRIWWQPGGACGGSLDYSWWQHGGARGGSLEYPSLVAAWRRPWWQPAVPLVAAWASS